MKLCIDCKHYQAEADELHDVCTHPRAECSGVRVIEFYSCRAMRAGICGKEAELFQPRNEVQS